MSQSVVFIVPEALHMERWERFLVSLEDVLVEGGGEPRELRVQRTGLGEIVRFRELGPAHEVADSYRANGLYPPSWRVGLVGKRFFQAQYPKWLPFRAFLTTLLNRWQGGVGTLQVDDDYGEIWSSEDLLQSLNADSTWDWRCVKSWHLSMASQQPIAFEDLAEGLRRAHPTWGAIHSQQAEVRWDGASDERRLPVSLNPVFYAFRSESLPDGDPILGDMLSRAFGFPVSENACFLLRFSDLSLAKVHLSSLLKALGKDSKELLIDFDHDLVLAGDDALQWMDLDPEWDWR